jgi:ArsR family metal-binding transcriptional regulator
MSYNVAMNDLNKLVTEHRFDLVEDHHSSGSGRYAVRVILPVDISASFPYLNSLLEDTLYDHANSILIGFNNNRRYAFRPYEIQAGMVTDSSEAPPIAEEAIELVNRVWMERERITPSFKERKRPAVYDLYKLLPKINCKGCGYSTCLAFAADLRNGVIAPDRCALLARPEFTQKSEQIHTLLTN